MTKVISLCVVCLCLMSIAAEAAPRVARSYSIQRHKIASWKSVASGANSCPGGRCVNRSVSVSR